MEQKLTPLMQQYWEIKNQHLDKILLFRMGDFYEMFNDDAVKAAPILNIALTSRNKNDANTTPMCGVPYHSIGPQINKLLKAGLKVAICDQLETPAQAEGKIVKRGVTRVVTPGLVYDPDQLESSVQNYVCALVPKPKGVYDFAAIDATTGELKISKNIFGSQVILLVRNLAPKELVVPEKFELFFDADCILTARHFEKSTSAEDFLVEYVRTTQGDEILFTIGAPTEFEAHTLKLSPTTLKHLEVFKTYDQADDGTLFDSINLTVTPMGARLLKNRLMNPFVQKEKIIREQDLVYNMYDNVDVYSKIRLLLKDLGDIERKIVKLSNPLCNARDLFALGRALEVTSQIIPLAPDFFKIDTHEVANLASQILSTLKEELPHSTKEGSLIRPGLNSTLDEYVDLDTHAQTKLSELEAKERDASGISSLKIKYNNIFGYSFEITKSNLNKTPLHFVRRQTLSQAERFITDELSQLEQKIHSAQTKRHELEFEIYNELRKKVLRKALTLLKITQGLAHLDLIQSFATLVRERNYIRPSFSDVQHKIFIQKSRHPVLELRDKFIPNDLDLTQGQCLLLTGPNMAGKSTIMRQVALTCILAQTGCFVPAEAAQLPLIDQIFTRIGASDNLSRGLSTFMVEMTETAQIIKEATDSSLIILDEIGRGTSTYDGLSLAQALLEHFVENVHGYTLFATHYHELTELADTLPGIMNAHMSIQEHSEGLVFLRKLVAGPANRSYGIEVAKLAGLPASVTSRATQILKTLTVKSQGIHSRQMDFMELTKEETRERFLELAQNLKNTDLNSMTPIEALNQLSQLKLQAETELQ